jgi:hypothetical protein
MSSKSTTIRTRRRAYYNDFERSHLELLRAFVTDQRPQSLRSEIMNKKLSPDALQSASKDFLFHILFCIFADKEQRLAPTTQTKDPAVLAFRKAYQSLNKKKPKPDQSLFLTALKALAQSQSPLGQSFNALPMISEIFSSPLSDQSFRQVFQALPYCQDSQEHFHDPQFKILTALYEQSLTSLPHWDQETLQFKASQDSKSRKKSGAFYTPPDLVTLLLDRTLPPILQGIQSESEVLDLRVGDPACGTGRFLIPAAKRLAQVLCKIRHAARSPCPTCLQDILTHCIHGVDIDPSAAQMCRFLLWIKIAQPTFPLHRLETIIRQGNALKTPKQDQRAPEIFGPKAFDLIIGNPPYVSFYSKQSKGKTLLTKDGNKQSWLTKIGPYKALPGRVNTFLLFLSLATKLVKENGGFAFILPDTILTNEHYAGMRRALLQYGRLDEVWLFKHNVFSDAAVGTSIVNWSNTSNQETKPIKLFEVDESEDKDVAITKEFQYKPQELLERPKSHWNPGGGDHAPELNESIPLDAIAHVKDGINPGPRSVRDRIISSKAEDKHSYHLIEGSNIRPLELKWSGRWIHCDPALLSREDKKRGASLRKEWIFDSKKIVYRQTASRPIAAIDLKGSRSLNSVHNIVLKEDNAEQLIALCCYLNSDLCAAIYKDCSGESRRLFPQVHISLMKTLPIPKFLLDPKNRWSKELIKIGREALDQTQESKCPESGKPIEQINQVMQNFIESQAKI